MKHGNQINQTIDKVLTSAAQAGVVMLTPQDRKLDGRSLTIQGKKMVNFGSCSYLGLETHPLLKKGVIEAVERYGTQFSSSRSYLSAPPYEELERLLQKIFGGYVIATPSITLGHLSAIPVLIQDEDAVILDHQVHATVVAGINKLKLRGVPVEIIRHNRLDQLKKKIERLKRRHPRIWYMADGVYSMHGDLAPIHDLYSLLEEQEELYIYIDDAHGMSWTGENGKGYILREIPLHPKMVIGTSLNKSFATAGGVLIFPDRELCRQVRTCGENLIFSGPIQPPMLGAAIASARLHLSPEIADLQNQLQQRISLCLELLKQSGLPMFTDSLTPIRFVGVGLPRVGEKLIRRLMHAGFFTNLAVFPAVPIKNTGVRFTLTLQQTEEDIRQLIQQLTSHLPTILKEEGLSLTEITRSFRLKPHPQNKKDISQRRPFHLQYETTVKKLPPKEWNDLFGKNGNFTLEGLAFLEQVFSQHTTPEHNWKFHYFLVRDQKGRIVLATFFTECLWKDDTLATENISREMEKKRKTEPYFLTSKILLMGSLASVGEHLYLDRNHPEWREILLFLLEKLGHLQDQCGAASLGLRDFPEKDRELEEFLFQQGFLKFRIPDLHVLDQHLSWKNREHFLHSLSPSKRRHQRKQVIPFEELYEVRVYPKKSPGETFLEHCYELYCSVREKNFVINDFALPKKLFRMTFENPHWDIIGLHLKEKSEEKKERLPVFVAWSFMTQNAYCGQILGMNFDFVYNHGCYRQGLWQVIRRAQDLQLPLLYLGMTSSLEKRRFGARALPSCAYFQAKDNFSLVAMNTLKVN